MAKKTRINLTIDKELWFALGLKCKGSKSKLIEELVREYVFSKTNIDELRDEIVNDEMELRAKKKALNEMVKLQEINDTNQELNNKALNTVRKILKNQGNLIGENQIKSIAEINGLTPEKLIREVKRIDNITVDKIYEPPRN